MASSLAAQLAQIAANSKASLDVRAQKAAHSKSLLFEPRVAATQSYQALYTICLEGFEELCELDGRFKPFSLTLFSEQSMSEDRTQMTAAENAELDKKVESFLRLVGSRLRLMPSLRALEWLVRRFRYIGASTLAEAPMLTLSQNPREQHKVSHYDLPSVPLDPRLCYLALDPAVQDPQ